MSALLSLYAKALKEQKFLLANEIEKDFISKALNLDWESKDMWMENLTLLSI